MAEVPTYPDECEHNPINFDTFGECTKCLAADVVTRERAYQNMCAANGVLLKQVADLTAANLALTAKLDECVQRQEDAYFHALCRDQKDA